MQCELAESTIGEVCGSAVIVQVVVDRKFAMPAGCRPVRACPHSQSGKPAR